MHLRLAVIFLQRHFLCEQFMLVSYNVQTNLIQVTTESCSNESLGVSPKSSISVTSSRCALRTENAIKSIIDADVSFGWLFEVLRVEDCISNSLSSWLLFVFLISPVVWNNDNGTAAKSWDNTAFRSIWSDVLTVINREKRSWWYLNVIDASFLRDIFRGLFPVLWADTIL